MNHKIYNKKDLANNSYAITSYDAEDGTFVIVSLHKELSKANKRLDYLRKKINLDISLTAYGICKTDDNKLLKCFNMEVV